MNERLIRELLEEILDSGRSPEDVCGDRPELIADVRERLARLRAVEAEVDAIFPTPVPAGRGRAAGAEAVHDGRLPRVPGHAVEAVLGRGGMGVVYRATHLRLGRAVAVKMVLMGAHATARELECLLREAEAVAALHHPNIVQVYEVGELDGLPYFTMEYVEGGTLAERLAGVPQSAKEAATLVATLADAVQAAHERGIVHRDLKPSNILLTAEGVPKIVDFSVARRLASEQTVTIGSAHQGTPSYMAPEQAAGREEAYCPAVDVYSLGAVLYEALTGRPPFRADTASETQRQVITESPAPPSRLNMRVPRDLETICLKCLHKEPARRYESAGALAEDLRRFLHGEPIAARPVGRLERAARWAKRNPTGSALLVTALALVVVAGVAGAREWALAGERRAESVRWADRLEHIHGLQRAGRFEEARAVLGRVPEASFERLRHEIARARTDLDLVERLDEIRLNRGTFMQGGGIDYEETSRRYEAAFRDTGLAIFDEAPARIAAQLDGSPVREAIVAALDDWAACMTAEHRPRVLEVARRLDPDPWRDSVRDPARWADVDHLEVLAADARVNEQPVTILVAMGTRWRRLGGDPREFLLRVQRRFPDDFWVNFELGHLHGDDHAAAVGFFRAALAARPHAAVVHYNLGVSQTVLGRPDEARHHFERTLAEDPRHTWALRELGKVLLRAGAYAEATARFDRALALDPADREARVGLAAASLGLGQGGELRARWAEALDTEPASEAVWDGYAEFCLFLGNRQEYGRACEQLLERFGGSKDPRECERIGRACLLAPGPQGRIERAAGLIDRSLAAPAERSPPWVRPYYLVAKGLAEYRLGRFEIAAEVLSGEAATALGPAPMLILAMTRHRLGDNVAARRTLDDAVASFDWSEVGADSREAWIYHILRREAEAVVLGEMPRSQ